MYQDATPDTHSQMKTLGIDQVKRTLVRVGVDQLHPGPWQFRREFSRQSIAEMASSLKVGGGINSTPLEITPRKAGGWYIICGERRWRGAQAASIHELDCLLGEYTNEQASFKAIVDNIQREQFNPIEEAMALKSFLDQNKTHDEIAAAVGRSRGHVSNYLRLLTLDIQVRDHLIRGSLTPSHGRLLCSIESPTKQRAIAASAVRGKWSYKTLQIKINEVLQKPKPTASLSSGDPDVDRLARIISEETGYACVIKKSPAGVWQAGFLMTDNDQFAGLLERMGIDVEI